MGIVLDPQSLRRNSDDLKLNTINKSKILRVKRTRDDLDHYFIESETKARASYLGLPYIDLYGFPIDTAHLTLLSKQDCTQYQIGVFTLNNKEAYLATPNPDLNVQAPIIQKLAEMGLRYKIFLCSYASLEKLINTFNFVMIPRKVDDEIHISEEKIAQKESNKDSLQHLGDILQTVSLSDIIETILIAALQNDASDIHFEPEKENLIIRLRLDGVLHSFATLRKDTQKGVESRIKMISGLKLNVDNIPQDGRFSFKAGGCDIDVRVSMLPSNYGYSVVMRLLGTGSVALQMDQLGFVGLAKSRIEEAISRPQGTILTTGPTGSGKTTTLYTFLTGLNDGETKIITLEDPIEYKLQGISQTQIDAAAGYTFASGLRSILRQDPDIVMVGEIRDGETAEIAVQASLTGHQVLSTIHTNDAAGAIPRMMEMGIKGFLLADSLAAIIGQRLVRRICPYCKHEDNLDPLQKKVVFDQIAQIPATAEVKLPAELKFYTSSGCDKCNGLGYKGRIGVYEVMTITNGLRNLLSDRYPSIMDVRTMATQEGMLTMFQDGVIKALQGTTDIKELMRNVNY
jgi:type II secretory ATPase GspE/PulE/Tfp pilus assembly ATPase PilB-like protein